MFGNRAPASMAIYVDIVDKLFVFFRRPKPSLHLLFVAARVMAHLSISLVFSLSHSKNACTMLKSYKLIIL